MKAPLTLEQIHPEGGTHAYLIRFPEHQILAFGGMNYIEREIAGLEPDVVLIGAGASRKEILHRPPYARSALSSCSAPDPLGQLAVTVRGLPAARHFDALQSFLHEIAVVSPQTKVIVPKYFQPISLAK
jgi:hypothetical protein